ncbi:jasmonate-induced protein homolog [Chenopodium quinoa]|uniref:Uncharacterized protein n=1 Tax=Chenopodium quinoa TaxID=63459 RepID=A0A803LG33_CHEQI|nr:jasmonate-induced protein homolog [Chenopodium quinoa]
MASTTTQSEEEVSVELSSQENAVIDEMIKDAKNSCLSEEIVNKCRAMIVENGEQNTTVVGGISPVIALGGTLKNQTRGTLTVLDSKLWAGIIVKKYPDPLDRIGLFAQGCAWFKGIKAAVVYTGENSAGVECGWLLAWADSKTKGRRIYAKCGRKSEFECIDWEHIKEKLKKAFPVVRAHDSSTGTSVYGTIIGVESAVSTEDAVLGVFTG